MNQLLTPLYEYGLYFGIPLVFLAFVAWIYRASVKKRFEKGGEIPFREDEEVDHARRGRLRPASSPSSSQPPRPAPGS